MIRYLEPLRLHKPGNNLLLSGWLSMIGDSISDIAILTLIYNLTHSPSLIASIFIFKTSAIFVSSLMAPWISSYFADKKILLITIDLFRALFISSLVYINSIEYIFLVVFINTILNGMYHPVKQSGIKFIVKDEERIKYFSLDQSVINGITLIIPPLAGFLVAFSGVQIFFIIDAISFILSALVLIPLKTWNPDSESDQQHKSLLSEIFKGYKIVFSTASYRNILYFRLLLLFALSCYEVLKLSSLTDIANNITSYAIPDSFSFSLLIGIFTSAHSCAVMLTSFYVMKKYKSKDNLQVILTKGFTYLGLGFLIWLVPLSFQYSWLFYLLGTSTIAIGLGFSRIGLYTAGNELTTQNFIEVVSTSDAIARLWQALVSSVVVGVLSGISVVYVIGLATFSITLSVKPRNFILKLLKDRS